MGANIAEAFGRFHYGEKLQFLYYARGSLFEAKYWLNRALARGLMPATAVENYASQLTNIARQLNAFASTLKAQRSSNRKQSKTVREPTAEYITNQPENTPPLFTKQDLEWLATTPNT